MQRHYHKYVRYMGKTNMKKQSGSWSGVGHEGRSPKRHYSISGRSCGNVNLYKWVLGAGENDPALKVRGSVLPQCALRC